MVARRCVLKAAIFLAGFMLFFCGTVEEKELAHYSYSEEVAAVVSSVTGGEISEVSPIRVCFVENMVAEDMLNRELKDDFSRFTPNFTRTVRWEDRRTLVFQPKNKLKLRQVYTANLDLARITGKSPADLPELSFDFKIAGREVEELKSEFINSASDAEDKNKVIFQGSVLFSRPLKFSDLKRSFSFTADGNHVPIYWDADYTGSIKKEYSFHSGELSRKAADRICRVRVDRSGTGLLEDYTKEYKLTAQGKFAVSAVERIKEMDYQGFKVIFSDKLDRTQDLSGLIRLVDGPPISIRTKDNSAFIFGNFESGKSYKLLVSAAVRSSERRQIEIQAEYDISVESNDPQLVFLSDGMFLPSTNKQKLAFKTMNVKKVHVGIVKVFENNIGQFLQVNKLDSSKTRRNLYDDDYYYDYYYRSSDEINRVGVTVVDKNLDLGSEKNTWQINALDLSALLKPQDKGLFLITLSFGEDDIIVSPSGYRYRYNSSQVIKPVIASDIGITYKKADEMCYVYVTDLISAKPLAKVKVSLMTYQNQVIQAKESDAGGILEFKDVSESVFYILAERSGERSVIKINEMQWNLSSFDTEGTELGAGGVRAFVYTERGVYRPGDQINLSAVFRNKDESFPDNLPVTINLYNPRGQLARTETLRFARDGFYNFAIQSSEDDLTGDWKAELLAGSASFVHTIKVETIVPFRLKLLLSTDKENYSLQDEKIVITLLAKYLFGTPAAELAAEIKVVFRSLERSFKNFPGYTFSDDSKHFSEISRTVFDSSLDENGQVLTSVSLPDLSDAPSAVTAVIQAKVLEKGGRPNYNVATAIIDPYQTYVGLERPDFRYGYAKINELMKFHTVLVDSKGESVAGRTLQYRVYRNSHYWWWQYDSRDEYRRHYKTNKYTTQVQEGKITSGRVPVELAFQPKEWGEYFIEIVGPDGHTVGFFFYASYWGFSPDGTDEAAFLPLRADKKVYHPGDTAQISFPSPKQGTLLVTLEKAGSVYRSYVLDVDAAKEETTLEVKIVEDMVPNMYLSVSMLQPHAQTVNDRPLRMYGVLPLMVEDPQTRQDIEILMPDELRPNKPFEVEVQFKKKEQTQFTIAIVDEGLLDITRFATPDIWDAFYKKQRLTVSTYDMFGYVIGADKGIYSHIFSVGGDYDRGMFTGESEKKSRRFEPVSLFQGPVYSDKNGHAKLSFAMPNYMGSVRVMVISAKGKSYGKAEKTVAVKEELMVQATLPRVLGPDDSISIPVSVFVMKEGIKKVNVKISVSGPVELVGDSTREIAFSTLGDQEVFFNLKAKKEVGFAEISIEAVSGSFHSYEKINLAVRASSPPVFDSWEKELKRGQSLDFTVPEIGIKGTNFAKININRLPQLNWDKRMDWLIQYPHGCIEQTTSSVFPQLYLKEFSSDKEKRGQIDDNINAGIARLRRFQTSSGGFSYWPGDGEASPWGTNYAGHFMIEAKQLGYHVPEDMLVNWIRYQTARALDTSENLPSRVYRIYLLSLAGSPSHAGMNLLKENNFKDMTDTDKWTLAAAYLLAGLNDTAQSIAAKAGTNVRTYREFSYTYGSTNRDKAIILEKMTLFGNWSKSAALFKELVTALSSTDWYSTQTTGYMLLSLGKFIIKSRTDKETAISGYIEYPDKRQQKFSFMDFKYTVDLSAYTGQKIKVYLDSSVTDKLTYLTLEWSGIPYASISKAISRQLQLSVDWYTEDGDSIDPVTIPQGSSFWAIIRADKLERIDIEELAVTQMIPAGWEIENTRLSGEELPAWIKEISRAVNQVEYTDIRDDRIMWYLDMTRYTTTAYFAVKLNAVTVGKFSLPPTSFEAMYDNTYYALCPGFPVYVTKGGTFRIKGFRAQG